MEVVLTQISKGVKISKLLSIDVNNNQYIKILMKKIDANGPYTLNNEHLKLNSYCYSQMNLLIDAFAECVFNLDLENSFNNVPYFWKYINTLLNIVLNIDKYPLTVSIQLCNLFKITIVYLIDVFEEIDIDTNNEFNLKENITLLGFKLFQQLKPLPSLTKEYHPIYDDFDNSAGNNNVITNKRLPLKYKVLIDILPHLIKSFQNNKIFLQTLNTNIPFKFPHLDEYELANFTRYNLLAIEYYKAIWLLLNKQDVLACLKIMEELLHKLFQLGQHIPKNESIWFNYQLVLKTYALVKLSIDQYITSTILPPNICQLVKLVHDGNFQMFDAWLCENEEWLLKDQLYQFLVEKLVLVIFKNIVRLNVIISKSNKIYFDDINLALKLSVGNDIESYKCNILKNMLITWTSDNGWLDIFETLISLNYIKGNVVSKLQLVLLINNGSDKKQRQIIFPKVVDKMK